MQRCPQCGRHYSQQSDLCADCTESNSEQDSVRLVAIARFGNAAEAGFFAHELMLQESITTRIIADESFDALNGTWTTQFVLSVPESVARAARSALVTMCDQTSTDDFHDDSSTVDVGSVVSQQPDSDLKWDAFDSSVSNSDSEFPTFQREPSIEGSGVNWVPIMLTLAAGSAVFWAVRKINDPPIVKIPPRQQTNDLWHHLTDRDEPWVQRSEGEAGVRELRYDRDTNRLYMREDIDGDGVFENVVQFDWHKPAETKIDQGR